MKRQAERNRGGAGERFCARQRQHDDFCVAHDDGLPAMGNCVLRARFRDHRCTVQMNLLKTITKTSTW